MRQRATEAALPLLTVWWTITPFTGPQAPLWLRWWVRQPGVLDDGDAFGAQGGEQPVGGEWCGHGGVLPVRCAGVG